ncbi:MAG: hypothetical protein GY679_02745 [Mycoplasma sp.]|nr:hypothetical protein [Mycoplasma sp.]
MRRSGWIRLGVGALASTSVITITSLVIVFGLKDVKLSHNNVRVVLNQVKETSWYQGDASSSFGSFINYKQQMTSTTLLTSNNLGNDEYNYDQTKKGWNKTNNLLEVSRLGLADYILLKNKDDKYIGFKNGTLKIIDYTSYSLLSPKEKKNYQFNDEIKSFNTTKGEVIPGEFSYLALQYPINNHKTKFQQAAELAKGGFDLHIRDNIYWIDNHGNKTQYKLKPKDFFYSVARSALGGSRRRLMPATTNNPFGGFEDKRGYPLSDDEIKAGKKLDENIRNFQNILESNANSTTTSLSVTDGLPNDYLYGLYNYRGLLKQSIPASTNTGALPITTTKNSRDVVGWEKAPWMKHHTEGLLSFETFPNTAAEKDKVLSSETVANLKGILISLLSHSQALIPAPSDYIRDVITTKKLTTNSGQEISVPNGLLKAVGSAVYASSLELTLSVAPMYISESTPNRTKYIKNKHFWNQKWVKSHNAIDEWIIDYVSQPDSTLFAQSQLAAFNSGRIARMNLVGQPKNQLLSLSGRNQAIFSKGALSNESVGSLLPQINPKGQSLSNFNFNDEYSKLVFGASRQEIIAGKSTTAYNFTSPKAIAFRSLISSAINWFAFAKEAFPDNSKISWLSSMPPNMLINPDSSNKTEEVKDSTEEINSMRAFVPTNGGKDLKELLSSNKKQANNWKESKEWFINNSSNRNVAVQSSSFKEIQKQMKTLLDNNVNGQVAFEIRNYFSNYTDIKQGLDAVVKVINKIYPQKLRVGKLSDANDRGPTLTIYKDAASRNKFFGNSSYVIGGGWGADYQGFGTMLSYFDLFGLTTLASSIQKRSKTNISYKNTFKELIAYADIMEYEFKNFKSKQTPSIQKALLNFDQISNHQNGQGKGSRFFNVIQNPSAKLSASEKKEFRIFLNNKLKSFSSIIDRKIQVNGFSISKNPPAGTPANIKSAYGRLSNNANVVKLLSQIRDLIGKIPHKTLTIQDPSSPTPRLVQDFLQISVNSNKLFSPLDVIVDEDEKDRRTKLEWLNN